VLPAGQKEPAAQGPEQEATPRPVVFPKKLALQGSGAGESAGQ